MLHFWLKCRYHTCVRASSDDGNRDFFFHRRLDADTTLRLENVLRELLTDMWLFHFGALSLTHGFARTTTKMAVQCAKECCRLP